MFTKEAMMFKQGSKLENCANTFIQTLEVS